MLIYSPPPPHPHPQEIKPDTTEPMKLEHNSTQSEIEDGDIICFQIDISVEEIYDLKSRGLCSNPLQFYEFLRSRMAERDESEESRGSVDVQANA